MTATIATRHGSKQVQRQLNVRRDTLDFRDRMFEASLIEVPTHMPLSHYRKFGVPVLDQGEEGACTGFGLATVANYLLSRRKVVPDKAPVSARMLYEMARRYDEWPGENYSGSSARGAMKGWQKHGVCRRGRMEVPAPAPQDAGGLTQARTADALRRPLGAYLRVNHKDLVAMHSALAEVGVLFATATVHQGWAQVDAKASFPIRRRCRAAMRSPSSRTTTTASGSRIPGATEWGAGGFARISYDDWLANGTDVWVARLGAPVVLRLSRIRCDRALGGGGRSAAYSYSDLRPHIVSLGNDGALRPGGDYGTSPAELQADLRGRHAAGHGQLARKARAAVCARRAGRRAQRDPAAGRLPQRDAGAPTSIRSASSGTATTGRPSPTSCRTRCAGAGPKARSTAAKDFLLDRLDDTLEILARSLTGKASWDEMKENALGATAAPAAARSWRSITWPRCIGGCRSSCT